MPLNCKTRLSGNPALLLAPSWFLPADASAQCCGPAGAAWADTPRQVAEASDVVFTYLPGPVEVEAVATGEHGLLGGLRASSTP